MRLFEDLQTPLQIRGPGAGFHQIGLECVTLHQNPVTRALRVLLDLLEVRNPFLEGGEFCLTGSRCLVGSPGDRSLPFESTLDLGDLFDGSGQRVGEGVVFQLQRVIDAVQPGYVLFQPLLPGLQPCE